jgi:phthiocerol/phenolphthiocerol synthesis type-I polyketide synthase E
VTADLEEAIAVTGMAARLPGARDIREFWSALRGGVEGVTHHDKGALLAAGGDPELIHRSDYVASWGTLPAARNFDWSFFGYSRAEAALIDPQQRIFLECAADALDDAGIDPTRFPGWIGVYGGSNDVDTFPDLDVSAMLRTMGSSRDFLATRVAYKLGLRGPAFTVQTACSTSLTAVHLAIQSLQSYECDAALAGGVGLTEFGSTGYLYHEGGAFSRDGRCRTFDEGATGTVPGEAVGVVVLRRLEDALRDGDHVSAIIRGSAINNDGGDKIGFTAPSVAGQRDVIVLAQKVAGVDPWDVDYVEAHGTATPIGDPVEVQALTDSFRRSHDGTGWCQLGAVKSNIGHTGAAAGVAGLIKTALMLEHRELVPSLHFTRPNPVLGIEQTPFRVCTRHEPWPDRGTPLAAVSAFGVGGTNVHVIVQAPPPLDRPVPRQAPRVLGMSAASPGALDRVRDALADHLARDERACLADTSRTLARRRRFEHRLAVVAQEPQEAVEQLRARAYCAAPAPLGPVAFLFPGHGTLDYAAGAAAYRLMPDFRGHFDEMAEVFRREHGLDLSPIVTERAGDATWFADPVNQQCGLVTLGYALARQLMDWGITPSGMLGNSIGEYTAALVAGLWTPADCAGVLYESLQTTKRPEPGRMIAVGADADRVTDRIAPFRGVGVAIAGPRFTVISGPEGAIDACLAAGALDGLSAAVLDSPVAGHSEAMRPAAEDLARAINHRATRAPALPFISNLTGGWADPDAVTTPDYWTAQLCRTVRLDSGIKALIEAGCDTFVELGAGTSMSGSLRRHRAWGPGRCVVPMLGRVAEGGERGVLRAIGTLWERGANIDLAAFTRGEPALVVALPAYPFEATDPQAAQEPKPEPERQPDRVARREAPSSLERLWCTTLGVASVTATDDFFALGGESLLAVHLIAEVRERTGTQIAVADFVRRPTFGRLVELAGPPRKRSASPADDADGADRANGLVFLREGAQGRRPVFFAADALGSASSYLVLANLIEAGRPIYGLEPTGGPAASARIEHVAEQHLTAVRGVQPQGPYTLGGWSYGAVVAHEMARRLTGAGESVDVLMCIDGAVRDPRGRPIGADPAVLVDSVQVVFGVLFRVGPIGSALRRTPELRRNFTRSASAMLRYRPGPVPCPMVLFKAGAPDLGAREALRRSLSGLYSSVEVLPADGDHWSMLSRPHADGLARELSARLSEPAGVPPATARVPVCHGTSF